MLASMLLNMRFSKEIFHFRQQVSDCTSSRTNIITEVLRSMLSVKAFGWESPFTRKVHAERGREAWKIRVVQAMKAVSICSADRADTVESTTYRCGANYTCR
jgi:hypothetical protein